MKKPVKNAVFELFLLEKQKTLIKQHISRDLVSFLEISIKKVISFER